MRPVAEDTFVSLVLCMLIDEVTPCDAMDKKKNALGNHKHLNDHDVSFSFRYLDLGWIVMDTDAKC